jgi:hypothetical protein
LNKCAAGDVSLLAIENHGQPESVAALHDVVEA